MDGQGQRRRELQSLAVDLAAVRVAVAFARYLDGRKYDPHPVRQPTGAKVNGRGVGGRFAPKAGGAAGATAVDAMAFPEAAAAAGPGVVAAAVGGVAVSREAGLFAHYMDGQAITPILGLPGGKLETGPAPLLMSGRANSSEPLGQFDDDCDDQLENDLATCQTNAAMYGGGRGGYTRKQIRGICKANAYERYSECITGKSLRPLFSGMFFK